MHRLWYAPAFFTLVAVAAATQATPDFSGRWTAISPGSAAGQVLIIAQDKGSIRLEPGGIVPDFSSDYRLDGETTVASTGGGNRIASTAKWKGGKLLLIDISHDPIVLRHERTLAIDRDGRLILERLKPRTTADQEPAVHSAEVLDSTRIVFEKR